MSDDIVIKRGSKEHKALSHLLNNVFDENGSLWGDVDLGLVTSGERKRMRWAGQELRKLIPFN